jgi:type II secretory pathway component GspD/PulD (secretin)/tetratricopeptide (TPR) repeat protein
MEQIKYKLVDVQLEGLLMKRIPENKSRYCASHSEAATAVAAALWTALLLSPFLCATSFAQTPDSVAEREVQRREAAIPDGEAALARGKSAMKAKNYTLAHEEFRSAVSSLPDSVGSGKARDQAVDGFCKSGVALAEARIAEGRNADAEAILSEILSDRYDPKCRPAHLLYTRLRQPGSFDKSSDKTVRTGSSGEVDCAGNPAPPFPERVERVKELLAEADSFYQTGRYDLAMKRYDQVLCLDPYNTAARRGQEKVSNTKYQYGEEAYNETRARQMWQVQGAWQQPVRKYGAVGAPAAVGRQQELGGTAAMTSKLNKIIIPHIEFRDATIREAIDVLREQAAENDTGPEGQRGVNIVLRLVPLGQIAPPSVPVQLAPTGTGTPVPGGGAAPPEAPAAGAPPAGPGTAPGRTGPGGAPAPAPPAGPANARITVTLDNVPLGEALRYIANQAALKLKVEPYAVSVIPLSEQTNELITKRYHVPAEFFGGPLDVGYYVGITTTGGGGGQGGNVQPVPVAENVIQKEAVSFQTASGTGTGAGATSTANLVQGTATTRQSLLNDRQLVGRADARTMLQSMGVAFPPGASATFWPHNGTLIVRNTQDNLDFVDALVDQANASLPKQVEIESKFIEINQNNLKELGFDWLLGPFSLNGKVFGSGGTAGNGQPVNGANYPFVDPATGNPIGQNPVTAGNQSGNFAISANALDALLMPGLGQVAGAAPGIFGLAGVFTNPQFQVVIRALNQKKGIDLLSAPSVTTKSGQRAIVEVIREFRYPKTYTAPQVPSISSGTTTVNAVVPVVVTPTTPQDWDTRNTGVTLEVEPVVGGDATTIDLNLVPQVVEFEGFINYGSPINAVGVNTLPGGISVSQPVELTKNVINQPVFSTRKVTTSVSVYDGQTVVLGGLMREDVQKTEDKVPILGDIPLIGRAFRTNVEQHEKKNLVMFVTARIVTPAGLPLNEEEEGLVPPELPEVPAYKK